MCYNKDKCRGYSEEIKMSDNSIAFKQPIIRIHNRELNCQFYQKSLGFRLILEENSIALFSDWGKGQSFFTIEESPAYRTRQVNGTKKLSHIILRISKYDILALLGNGAEVHQLFKGNNGYAFETISPEGHIFLVHDEEDWRCLEPVEMIPFSPKHGFNGVSSFIVETVVLHVPDSRASESFYRTLFGEGIDFRVDFKESLGDDLTVTPSETWDLEILEYQVPKDYDLGQLKKSLEESENKVYLDKKEQILVVSDPSNIELWFSK